MAVIDDSETSSPSPEVEESPASDLPTEDELDELFAALTSNDIAEVERALRLTKDGSLANAYVGYRLASLNAFVDNGTLQNFEEAPASRIDDGYESCEDPSDESTCARWTNIQGSDGVVVSFDVNDTPLDDVLVRGTGKPQSLGGVGALEVLFVYQSPVSGNLFVIGQAQSRAQTIELSALFSATYRDPSGRQFKAADSINPGELGPDSTANFTVIFPAPAKIGGTVSLGVYDASFNELTAQFATK